MHLSSTIGVTEPKSKYINCESSVKSGKWQPPLALSVPDSTVNRLQRAYTKAATEALSQSGTQCSAHSIGKHSLQSLSSAGLSSKHRVTDVWAQLHSNSTSSIGAHSSHRAYNDQALAQRRSLLQRPDFERLTQLPAAGYFDSRKAARERRAERTLTKGLHSTL